MTRPITERGKNAHRKTVESGRYVMAPATEGHPNGRLILLQAHLEMKPGWRLATFDEVSKAHAAERDRKIAEARAALAAIAGERARCDAVGELERTAAADNAERMAAKAMKVPRTLHTIPEGDEFVADDQVAGGELEPTELVADGADGELELEVTAPTGEVNTTTVQDVPAERASDETPDEHRARARAETTNS